MKNRPWDILAAVELFKTEEGGRKGATPPSIFTCMLQIDGLVFDVRMHLDDLGALSPGQEAIVPISFLNPLNAASHFSIGAGFVLREVRPIGKGFVEKTAFL